LIEISLITSEMVALKELIKLLDSVPIDYKLFLSIALIGMTAHLVLSIVELIYYAKSKCEVKEDYNGYFLYFNYALVVVCSLIT